jgi:hypothetical protein
MKTKKGRPERYDSTSRRSALRRETVWMGKTYKASMKRPLDGPSNCTRMCKTLGHTLSVTRTSEERTHRRAAGVIGEMRSS